MDTPESPTQSPQSPDEEERGLSDSELLQSPDEEADQDISDSELLQEENGGLLEEDEEEEEVVGSRGRGLEFEDEVVPDFVSDPEDEEPVGDAGGPGGEDETIVLMERDDDGPRGGQLDEEEDRILDTPQSPDSEPERVQSLIEPEEEGEDGEEGYDDYRKDVSAGQGATEVDDDDEEEEEDKNKSEEEDQRRRAVVREMKDDSASVSRELDEHELDYDEEVPEEPSIPAHDEDYDEDDTKVEGEEEEEEDKSSKKREKKPILPPSPKDGESRRTDESRGPERMRRDSFRDKKKEEDDGEIDEGEIDVSDLSVC